MEFDLKRSVEILERTPFVLETMLAGISEEWIMNNEGPDTWSPFDVVGHLVHGEKTDWMTRTKIILSNSDDKAFKPFDRFAQFESSKGKSLNDLLQEFKECRAANLKELKELNITDEQLKKTGVHPHFGEVTLSQLLSTWTTHDLSHIAQCARVMARQYKEEVGPWEAYLPLLHDRK